MNIPATSNKHAYLLFLVLTILFYGNSLKNKYSVDDDYVTVTNFPVEGKKFRPNNPLVEKGFAGIHKIWKSRYAHDANAAFDYRPVVTTTFAIEYGLFGQNPFISHLINILLYFFIICLVYSALLGLLQQNQHKESIALFTSILFLIHPIHTEVVDNLKSRDEMLAMCFGLIALKCSLLCIEKPRLKYIAVIIVSLFLGYFAKKTVILWMAGILVALFFYRNSDRKKLLAFFFGLLAVYFLCGYFNRHMPSELQVHSLYHFENPLYTEHFSFFQKIIIGIETFGFYIRMLIWPFPLRFYYGYNMLDFSGSFPYILIAFLGLAAIGWLIFKKRQKDVLFASVLFLVFIFPFLNIAVPVAGIVGERLMFIPSLAACLLAAFALKPCYASFILSGWKALVKKPFIYMLPLIFICLVTVLNRNAQWHDKTTLLEHDIALLEHSAKANSMLGNEYFGMLMSQNKKKYSDEVLAEKCFKYFNQAAAADSSLFSAYNNAGVVAFSYLKNLSLAEHYFKLAIRHKPLYAEAYENFGNCWQIRQRKDSTSKSLDSAFTYYKKSILADPGKYSPYMECVRLLVDNKRYRSALRIINLAREKFPADYEMTVDEANCLLNLKKYHEALSRMEEAYVMYPSKALSDRIAEIYKQAGDSVKYTLYRNKYPSADRPISIQ